jgi:hypothetical protein
MVAPVGQRASSPRRGSRGSAGRVAALGTLTRTVSGRSQRVTSGRPRRGGGGASQRRRQTVVPKLPCSPEDEQRAARLRRYQLQNAAARLLPGERVAHCLRRLSVVAEKVELQLVPETRSAHYRGLDVCGSVWHCPLCAARISNHRRKELAALVQAHVAAGGSVWMTTYTIRHSRFDDLAELLQRFLEARRRMRQGRRGQALRRDFGVIGTVSVLEVTWSEENGWHPHVHELVFSDAEMDADGYEVAARSAWEGAAAGQGLAMNQHGFELQRTYGAVADYIAKYGHEPAVEQPWGVESEICKGHLKQGRGGTPHYTPFALLAAIADGATALEMRWIEYAAAFKGRKQLTYSPHLRERYAVAGEEKTDAQLVEESEGYEAWTAVELEAESWAEVCAANVRGSLLELLRAGRVGDILEGLDELGIAAQLPGELAGWRVETPAGLATITTVRRCEILGRWRCSVQLVEPLAQRWRAYDLVDVRLVDVSPEMRERRRDERAMGEVEWERDRAPCLNVKRRHSLGRQPGCTTSDMSHCHDSR